MKSRPLVRLSVKRNWTEGRAGVYGYESDGEGEVISSYSASIPDLTRYDLDSGSFRPMREPVFLIFEEKAGHSPRGGRILVVADEVPCSLLGDADPLVCTGSKEDLLNAVSKESFDLVLLVCLRLGYDAAEVVRDLKASYPQMLVMVVTYEAPGEAVAEVFWAGARDCLIGDVERDLLRERMARLLEITNVGKETRKNLLLRSGRGVSGGFLEEQEEFVGPHNMHHPGIQRAVAFIHREYGRKLSLDEMARAAYMSRRHFSRMFREIMGTCPLGYVSRVRIGEAKRRLRQGGCSIAEVGQEVGFESAAYFHRVFKQLEGISPGAYREKVMRKGKMAG